MIKKNLLALKNIINNDIYFNKKISHKCVNFIFLNEKIIV